jgi:antagonist of KipI
MLMQVRVASPGLLTTVQDAGRYAYAHLGISPAGAADSVAFRIANYLVGNEQNAAAIEMTLLGATLEFDEQGVIALTGADCDCKLDGATAPMWEAVRVPPKGVLTCSGTRTGARTYLAIEGGLDVPEVMGSASTFLAGHFGGFEGRQLQKGDVLRVGKQPNSEVRGTSRIRPEVLERLYAPRPIRVTRGPQQDWFSSEAVKKFLSNAYTVTADSNRAGLRLKGENVRPSKTSQLLTEGVSLGAIQVPEDGQPIILFVDQYTTGGYPKIANVIAADMHCVGQLRPHEQVRFEEVTMPEAVQLVRRQEEGLAGILER